jgi:hypothetical protein
MQEIGAVGWDPVYERHLPLSSKLFVLYVFVLIVASLVRGTRLLRQLRWLKRHPEAAEAQRTRVSKASLDTIQSSRRLVILTCLLSGAVTATQVVVVLSESASQKTSAIAWMNDGLALAFVNLQLGLWVSTAMYAAFAFCERALADRTLGDLVKDSTVN